MLRRKDGDLEEQLLAGWLEASGVTTYEAILVEEAGTDVDCLGGVTECFHPK